MYEIVCMTTMPLYLMALYLLCTTFFSERRFSKKVELCSYLLYGVVISFVSLYVRIPAIMLITNLAMIFLMTWNYEGRVLARVFYSIAIYAIVLFFEVLCLGMVGFFRIYPFENSEFSSAGGMILIRLVTFVVAIYIHRFTKDRTREFPMPKAYHGVHILILLGTLYLFVMSLNAEGLGLWQMVLGGLVLMLVNALVLYADAKLYESMASRAKEGAMALQALAYEKQRETMEQSFATLHGLRHDMKNHLLTLQSLYGGGAVGAQTYVAQMLQEMEAHQNLLDSGNFVVDSIVNFKLEKLKDLGVKLRLEVEIPSVFNISDFDLTVILGNLLDNAVRALEEMAPEKDKQFTLQMQCDKGNLVLFMENSYGQPLAQTTDGYESTKAEKGQHGLGIANVKKTVAKYEGTLELEHTEDVFSLWVLLPY